MIDKKQTDSRRDRTQEEHHPRILGKLVLKGRTGTQSLVAGAYIVAAKAHDGVADALNNGADPGGQLGNKRLAGEEHTVRAIALVVFLIVHRVGDHHGLEHTQSAYAAACQGKDHKQDCHPQRLIQIPGRQQVHRVDQCKGNGSP